MGRVGVAWWPGGRTAQKADAWRSPQTARTASSAQPAAAAAASQEAPDTTVSGVSWTGSP